MKKLIKSIFSVFLMGIFSVSCGSGGVGGSGITASGGIGGTGVSQGTVTGFGSVIMNDVKYNVSGTTFIIDDNQTGTSQANLSIGMRVKVRGTVDDNGPNGGTGTATTIEYEPDVKGPVDSKNTTSNSLVVLGRTYIVDDSTTIEDSSGIKMALSALSIMSKVVEISGLSFSDDSIQATYIRETDEVFSSQSTQVELKGTIKSLNTGLETFSIGNQSVDYSSTTLPFIDMEKADLAEGLFIEVKGTLDTTSNTLGASKIDKEDNSLGALQNERVEVEGLVTAFTSSAAFSVTGQSVTTSVTTTFVNGAPDDIVKNVRLEVEGKMVNGVLVATKVKFHGNRIKIHATVQDVFSTAMPATVKLLNQIVAINAATSMKDDSSTPKATFSSVGDISNGDWLEIRGFVTGSGATRMITATRVERKDPEPDKFILQAPVDVGGVDSTNQTLTLMDVKVDTTSSLTKFQDLSDSIIPVPADFFSQVKEGTLVKARGTFSAGTIDADEVGFEED